MAKCPLPISLWTGLLPKVSSTTSILMFSFFIHCESERGRSIWLNMFFVGSVKNPSDGWYVGFIMVWCNGEWTAKSLIGISRLRFLPFLFFRHLWIRIVARLRADTKMTADMIVMWWRLCWEAVCSVFGDQDCLEKYFTKWLSWQSRSGKTLVPYPLFSRWGWHWKVVHYYFSNFGVSFDQFHVWVLFLILKMPKNVVFLNNSTFGAPSRLSIPKTQGRILFSHWLVDCWHCFVSMNVSTIGAVHDVWVLVGAVWVFFQPLGWHHVGNYHSLIFCGKKIKANLSNVKGFSSYMGIDIFNIQSNTVRWHKLLVFEAVQRLK